MTAQFKFIDSRNSREYNLLRVGEQLWMAKNIDYYIEGCSFGKLGSTNGYLYNQDALKRICPPGWHVPSRNEIEKLYSFFAEGFLMLGLVEKFSSKFIDENSGFQLAGYGSECQDKFFKEGTGAYFWTSSRNSKGNLLYCGMDYDDIYFAEPDPECDLFSIRLVYDDVFTPSKPKSPLKAMPRMPLKKEKRTDGPF